VATPHTFPPLGSAPVSPALARPRRARCDTVKLDELENEAATILCQLEMYFPHSRFDIMVHLIIHLVREIKCCGPIYLRWMYPVEQYMKILKGYTKNLQCLEAPIVERYIAEEVTEFCS